MQRSRGDAFCSEVGEHSGRSSREVISFGYMIKLQSGPFSTIEIRGCMSVASGVYQAEAKVRNLGGSKAWLLVLCTVKGAPDIGKPKIPNAAPT